MTSDPRVTLTCDMRILLCPSSSTAVASQRPSAHYIIHADIGDLLKANTRDDKTHQTILMMMMSVFFYTVWITELLKHPECVFNSPQFSEQQELKAVNVKHLHQIQIQVLIRVVHLVFSFFVHTAQFLCLSWFNIKCKDEYFSTRKTQAVSFICFFF